MKKLILAVIAVGTGTFGAWTLAKHGITWRTPDFFILSACGAISALAGDRVFRRNRPKA